ncbi:MAG: hypothetical protein [Wendovervirus sonii]|uniref:Uncharacterized protein n=1 Tax=phage Lak_Megaphage_Sonny TaxID=3109229 RepID=A0ABZ0Z441_9CAUD|nr:MAG: hypothetical protein [phage Lak_Megaphage_Sonny]
MNNKELHKRIMKNINESFSAWCDSNVPKFDMVGFTTNMISMFDVFNKLYDMDEVYQFRFIIYDDEQHKQVLFEYPDEMVASPEKTAQYFTDLLKSKLSKRPDELADNMKHTCMSIEINPDRYLYNYLQTFIDISSGQKLYIDESHNYYCVLHKSEATGKVNLYIMTSNFMENPDMFIEFLS